VRLGIIADTHGMLRPEVFDIFAQVDHSGSDLMLIEHFMVP
jgi:hypothetical protein